MSTNERLGSLDVFRGLVIGAMMFVNCAGHDPAFPGWIAHRGWNQGRQGLGMADYVFPLFLFIVGASAYLSAKSARSRGVPVGSQAARLVRRAATLYLLGTLLWCATIAYDRAMTLSVFLHWDILPLIAWAGLVCAVIVRAPGWVRATFVVAALAFKWYLLTRVVVPGQAGVVWSPELNAQRWLNGELGWFGVPLTQGPAAAALCVIGAECARHLDLATDRKLAAVRLIVAGCVGVAVSYAWHRAG
ncbi:MAG: heparan-alpha-glucosaminide N-acetyltransferase domain-containing protein, partial [Phycisphaerales bacterium]